MGSGTRAASSTLRKSPAQSSPVIWRIPSFARHGEDLIDRIALSPVVWRDLPEHAADNAYAPRRDVHSLRQVSRRALAVNLLP
jgi:hypothetical protein